MKSYFDIAFRNAVMSDLNNICRIFDSAVCEMNRCGIPQWDELYPGRKTLRQDISKNQMYIGLLNKEIACAYVINDEYDEQYIDAGWQFPDASFRVIHRLCVNPKYQHRGIGTITVRHIEKTLTDYGIEAIRLDVFSCNPHALRLYEKLGYAKVGSASWRKGRFYIMEKGLKKAEMAKGAQ